MANGVKTFTISINGIQESIKAVDSLNKQLEALESKINALSSKAVNISSSSGGGGSTSALSEDEKILKQKEQTEQKILAIQKEQYQELLNQKDILKDTQKTEASRFASDNLAVKEYSNTLLGLKDRLHDIKAAMQTEEIGNERFNQLSKEAGEITQKLKEIEQAYGVFSRSVGNYASAAEGFKKFKVTVGDVTREFDNARQAAKELKNELYNLGDEDVEQANKLRDAIFDVESRMKDALVTCKAMDEAMDWTESLAAVGSMGEGIKTLFGIGDSKALESIKKLQSLQSVLKGLETIRKQMATNEGIGMILSRGNGAIDVATNKLLAYNRALLGTGKMAKAAEKGIKAFNTALKAVKFYVIIELVSKLIEKFTNLFGTAEDAATSLAQSLDTINKSYEEFYKNLQTDYLTGVISQEEYLNTLYKKRAEQLKENAAILKSIGNNSSGNYSASEWDDIIQSIPLVGRLMPTYRHGYQQAGGAWGTFGHGHGFSFDSFDTSIYIQNLEEAEDALEKLNKAFEEGGEMFDYYISQLNNASTTILFTTQEDWDKIREEIGGRYIVEKMQNVNEQLVSATTAVADLTQQFNSGAISEEEFVQKMAEVKNDSKELYEYLTNDELLKAVVFNMAKFIHNDELRDKLMEAYDECKKFAQKLAGLNPELRTWWEHFINVETKRGLDRELAEIAEEERVAIANATELGEDLQRVHDEYDTRRQEKIDEYNREIADKAKAANEKLLAIERDIEDRRIDLMQDGLAKTVAQLTLERNRRLQEARKTGIRVGEQEELINRQYQQRVLNARIQYHQILLQEEQKFADAENNLQQSILNRGYVWVKDAVDRRLEIAIMALSKYPEALERNLEYYKNYEEEKNRLYDTNENQTLIVDEYKELLKLSETDLINSISMLNRDYLTDVNAMLAAGYTEAEKIVSSGNDDMYLLFEEGGNDVVIYEQTLTERLDNALQQRLTARENYYKKILELQKEAAKKQLELENSNAIVSLENELQAEERRFTQLAGLYRENVRRLNDEGVLSDTLTKNPILEALEAYERIASGSSFGSMSKEQVARNLQSVMDEVDEFLNELESGYQHNRITFDQYNAIMQSELLKTYNSAKKQYEDYLNEYNQMSASKQQENADQLEHYRIIYYEAFTNFLGNLEEAQETHNNAVNVINREYRERERQANLQYMQQVQSDTNQYFSNIIAEYDRGVNAISKTISTYQTQNRKSQEFGFINLKALNYEINAAKQILITRMGDINTQKEELARKLSLNEINEEDFSNQMDSLNALGNKVQEELQTLNQKAAEGVDNLVKVINNYIQVIGQSLQTILQAVWDYQDYEFEKEQDDLDKRNEILQKKLDEQEEILQKHSDAVNDIEDELSSARGDRRQHLIDQLNAEIQAQREAAAEKKEIEKQQEALQKKQDELDKQRKKAEYKRNLASILVQGAMAVSSGLATTPFVPVGIAMGALAASLTAYQYALAAKQKPYAKGGVLEGPSHSQGGIPVGNTGIEVEGQEYVIRKKSTKENVPVLDFINKSERKLTLDDFIDFYSTKPRATIKNIKSKFADGGVIPSTSSLDISEQLKDIVLVQSQQPIYVAVTDIERKMEDVRYVRTLAGVGK